VAVGALLALAGRRESAKLSGIRGHVGLLVAAVLVSAGSLAMQLVALGSIPLGVLETVKRGLGGVLAVVWGRAFFDEEVTPAKLGAVALLALGVALLVL
jgi:multidrug transporter EmrE-like cation transporter